MSSESEGDIGLGIVSLILGILLFFRFVFNFMVIGAFEGIPIVGLYRLNPAYSSLVYGSFHGTIDILMGFFGFLAFAILATERGGAGGLFLVVMIYSVWTAVFDLLNHLRIAGEIAGISYILITNIVIIIILAILAIAIALKSSRS